MQREPSPIAFQAPGSPSAGVLEAALYERKPKTNRTPRRRCSAGRVLGGTLILAAASMLLRAPLATGGELLDHFQVDVWGSGNSIYFEPMAVTGNAAASIGPLEGGVGTTRPASAEAHARIDRASLLRGRTPSAAPPATSTFDDRFGGAVATAEWKDILFASGGTPPADVLFHFVVDGTLRVTSVLPASVPSRPNVSTAGFIAKGHANLAYFGLGFATVDLGPPSEFVPSVKVEDTSDSAFLAQASSPWTSADLTSADGLTWNFSGGFEVASPLFSAGVLGTSDPGYLITVSANAGTDMRGSAGATDFMNTLRLDSITLADGSPLPADVTFAFDSGLSLVPEPNATLLFGSALAALGWLRRNGRSGRADRPSGCPRALRQRRSVG